MLSRPDGGLMTGDLDRAVLSYDEDEYRSAMTAHRGL